MKNKVKKKINAGPEWWDIIVGQKKMVICP